LDQLERRDISATKRKNQKEPALELLVSTLLSRHYMSL
jgi:hypothetical protein